MEPETPLIEKSIVNLLLDGIESGDITSLDAKTVFNEAKVLRRYELALSEIATRCCTLKHDHTDMPCQSCGLANDCIGRIAIGALDNI